MEQTDCEQKDVPLTRNMKRQTSWKLGLFTAIALYSLINMALFQGPVLSVILTAIELGTYDGKLLLTSTQILQFLVMCIVLFLLSIFSVRLMKGFMSLNLVVNAAALYYMNSYAIVLDRTMIGNILNTDQGEASQLWHPGLLLYLIPAIVAAILLLWFIPVRKPGVVARIMGFVASFALLVTWAFSTATTWFWYDLHGESMGSRVLPWSYVVNAARYANQQALRNREQVLLPDGEFDAVVPAGQKDVVILVIGEAARADHFAHYGYGKDTNPYTKDTDIAVLPMGESCATYTIAALACMLTHEGNAASARTVHEPIQSYLTRHGVHTEFRSNNFGEPPIEVDNYIKAYDLVADCTGADCPDPKLDESLLWELPELIQSTKADRLFITLHQTGSHGPAYYSKYSPEFGVFQPVCDTVQIAKCSEEELHNAYDNTLVYNDYLLAELVKELADIPDTRTAMIFVGDHGQSLGENGLYLHGAPISVAPPEQRLIPFYVWMSEGFKASRGLDNDMIMRDKINPHDLVFHSILGAFGLTMDAYLPERDLFNLPKDAS
ncbi:lipid A ethanolaminephosphotransferase [Aliiroseovarius halocynthiae]|nr:lipid A ethanolaminephosphotransferase [Aliiroseovarius halocynthiae]